MSEVSYTVIMWAEMKPDCYDGEKCDQLKARWQCACLGDMGDETDPNPIELNPATFPPGTKITIKVPDCPECGESSDMHKFPPGSCTCGFDWKQWTYEQYS